MKPDKTRHRQHAGDVEMQTYHVADHPVLAPHTVLNCPKDGCEYFEFPADETLTLDHDTSLPFHLASRLTELRSQIDLPVCHAYHSSGMRDPLKNFQTSTEARAYIFGRYGGPGNGSSCGTHVRKTYSVSHGSHTQNTTELDFPAVLAVVNTALGDDDYGHIVGSNLVPFEVDYPESEPWRASPSVEELIESRLNPPKHVIESKYRESKTRVPKWFDGTALEWHIKSVEHFEVVIQTPELFLDSKEISTGVEYEPDWVPQTQ